MCQNTYFLPLLAFGGKTEGGRGNLLTTLGGKEEEKKKEKRRERLHLTLGRGERARYQTPLAGRSDQDTPTSNRGPCLLTESPEYPGSWISEKKKRGRRCKPSIKKIVHTLLPFSPFFPLPFLHFPPLFGAPNISRIDEGERRRREGKEERGKKTRKRKTKKKTHPGARQDDNVP